MPLAPTALDRHHLGTMRDGYRHYLPLLLLVACASLLLALGALERLVPDNLLRETSHLLGLASSRPALTFSLLCAAIAATTAVGLPGAVPLFVAAGFLLGVPAAIGSAVIGNLVGPTILFVALKTAFFREFEHSLPDAGMMEKLRAGFARNRLAYALFLRAMPILPNGMATAALASLRCPLPIFLMASALGPLANAALMGWLGAQLARDVRTGHPIDASTLTDPRWWLPLLLLACVMLLPILIRRRMTASNAPLAKP